MYQNGRKNFLDIPEKYFKSPIKAIKSAQDREEKIKAKQNSDIRRLARVLQKSVDKYSDKSQVNMKPEILPKEIKTERITR